MFVFIVGIVRNVRNVYNIDNVHTEYIVYNVFNVHNVYNVYKDKIIGWRHRSLPRLCNTATKDCHSTADTGEAALCAPGAREAVVWQSAREWDILPQKGSPWSEPFVIVSRIYFSLLCSLSALCTMCTMNTMSAMYTIYLYY